MGVKISIGFLLFFIYISCVSSTIHIKHYHHPYSSYPHTHGSPIAWIIGVVIVVLILILIIWIICQCGRNDTVIVSNNGNPGGVVYAHQQQQPPAYGPTVVGVGPSVIIHDQPSVVVYDQPSYYHDTYDTCVSDVVVMDY